MTVDDSQLLQSLTTVSDTKTLTQSIKEQLSADELAEASKYATTLTVNHQNTIIDYGREQQDELSSFADNVLGKVRNKDLGEIGDSLRALVSNLNEADPEKLSQQSNSFLTKIFSRLRTSLFEVTAKYQAVSVQIDRSAEQLKQQEQNLLTDNAILDEMYAKNLAFYQEINVLIVGAKLKDEQLATEINAEQAKLTPGDRMQAQHVQDLNAMRDRLDKRVADLLLTREITVQQAPQIRLIQNSNSVLAEKIQASISTAIPLWKNQVGIALALLNQKEALSAQNATADATNALLKKNSELLHQSAVEIAQASQRGVVDVETLKSTQDQLISTITEVLAIQQDGRAKRQNVETELQGLEQSLQTNMQAIEQKHRIGE